EQAGGLRRELETRRVGATYDQRERAERPILDAIDLEKGIEAAQLAIMRERLAAGDVIGRGAGFRCDGKDPFGRGEQEFRFGIDEASDQPGTGDAIDLGALAGDPDAWLCLFFAALRRTSTTTGAPAVPIAPYKSCGEIEGGFGPSMRAHSSRERSCAELGR